jgi:hypothetical protein
VSRAIITLGDAKIDTGAQALYDTAAEAIDTYMTQGSDNNVFEEPAYKNTYYYDLNAFLKAEQFGKTEQSSPRLRALLAITKMFMGQRMGGHASRREVVGTAIKEGLTTARP